ncbi:hypothetical protein BAE44_0022787 [Dichanthelium oligosanthes]|uniref:LOB domain-containing protein n=1 Tax=Dichanthelium oligosanthes TaxID=888268 RepID=A0A1E5UTR9_9POAL|nr:hypothetical protein BAE44_0022787 [Dichanthelium oligosanthes]
MAAPGGGGAGAACAACKYQRRRCTPECPLAEYFPHDRPRVFRNAHRLFGVSNILKTLARAGPEKRREAMHCIIYESQAWDIYPASGCVPIIHGLQQRIRQAELDLRSVHANIQAYRAAQGRDVPELDGDSFGAASPPAPPTSFQFQPAAGNNDNAGGGGLSFFYGGDLMNAATSNDDNIATETSIAPLQMPSWIMQTPHYNMKNTAAAANVVGKLVPQPSHDYRFLVDATMVQHQPQQPIPMQPAELDDEMSYFVEDGDNEMLHESSMNTSENKAMKAPKMEDANGFK